MFNSWALVLTPVVLAIWEAEIGRFVVGGQLGQIVFKTLAPK
jgi:hypothetical protein